MSATSPGVQARASAAAATIAHSGFAAFGRGVLMGALDGLIGLGGAEFRLPLLIVLLLLGVGLGPLFGLAWLRGRPGSGGRCLAGFGRRLLGRGRWRGCSRR